MAAPYTEPVQLLLIKVETTSGVDAAPSASGDAVRTVGFPTVRMRFMEGGNRDDVQNGTMIATPRTGPAGRHMIVEATFEVAGSVAAGPYTTTTSKPEIDAVLRMMGFSRTVSTTGGSESILYTTLDQGMETATVWAYTAGKLRKAVGCVVTAARLTAQTNGRGLLAVTIMGKESTDPAEVAFPAFSTATLKPPLFHSGAASIGTWTTATVGDPLNIRSAELDFGITAADRPSAGAADGLVGFLITNRRVRQTLVVETPALATFDAFALARSSGTFPSSAWQIGTVQYNRLKVSTGPWAIEEPDPGATNSIMTQTLTGNLTKGGLSSGREIELLFD